MCLYIYIILNFIFDIFNLVFLGKIIRTSATVNIQYMKFLRITRTSFRTYPKIVTWSKNLHYSLASTRIKDSS